MIINHFLRNSIKRLNGISRHNNTISSLALHLQLLVPTCGYRRQGRSLACDLHVVDGLCLVLVLSNVGKVLSHVQKIEFAGGSPHLRCEPAANCLVSWAPTNCTTFGPVHLMDGFECGALVLEVENGVAVVMPGCLELLKTGKVRNQLALCNVVRHYRFLLHLL